MLAFFDPVQAAHVPVQSIRHGRMIQARDGVDRSERLLGGLLQSGADVRVPGSEDAAFARRVHTSSYLDFLAGAWDRWSRLPDAGPEVWPNYFPYWSGHPAQHSRPPCPSGHVVGQAGWYIGDLSAPMGPHTWRAALRSCASAVAAAEAVSAGERYAYALCRPSGHHARTDRAAGACFINNAAVAAETLRDGHRRVAVLDVDVHHGDGTQQIFYGRADVLTISIHADPGAAYPYFTGYCEERGHGPATGFNVNVPVPVGSGWDRHEGALGIAFDRLSSFAPDALVVALGFDSAVDDPVSLMSLGIADFERLGRLVGGLELPTVLVQEGGYGPSIGRCLCAFLAGLAERMP